MAYGWATAVSVPVEPPLPHEPPTLLRQLRQSRTVRTVLQHKGAMQPVEVFVALVQGPLNASAEKLR